MSCQDCLMMDCKESYFGPVFEYWCELTFTKTHLDGECCFYTPKETVVPAKFPLLIFGIDDEDVEMIADKIQEKRPHIVRLSFPPDLTLKNQDGPRVPNGILLIEPIQSIETVMRRSGRLPYSMDVRCVQYDEKMNVRKIVEVENLRWKFQ